MSKLVYTLAEAEKISGINRETLKKQCQNGKIDGAVKKGKMWLIPSFNFSQDKNKLVGVYIDGSNIYKGGLEAGWYLDYSLFKKFVERKYKIKIISYYNSTGYKQGKDKTYVRDNEGNYVLDPKALSFENMLRGLGIRVIAKPLKFIRGNEHHAANKFDGDLMIDAINESNNWDELILLSGDSDFEKLIKEVSAKNKKVSVFCFRSRISHEIKELAINSPLVSFTLLDELKTILEDESKKSKFANKS